MAKDRQRIDKRKRMRREKNRKRAMWIPDGYTITRQVEIRDEDGQLEPEFDPFDFTFRVPSGAEISDLMMDGVEHDGGEDIRLNLSSMAGAPARALLASKLVSWTLSVPNPAKPGEMFTPEPTLANFERLDSEVQQAMIDIMLSPVYQDEARGN